MGFAEVDLHAVEADSAGQLEGLGVARFLQGPVAGEDAEAFAGGGGSGCFSGASQAADGGGAHHGEGAGEKSAASYKVHCVGGPGARRLRVGETPKEPQACKPDRSGVRGFIFSNSSQVTAWPS